MVLVGWFGFTASARSALPKRPTALNHRISVGPEAEPLSALVNDHPSPAEAMQRVLDESTALAAVTASGKKAELPDPRDMARKDIANAWREVGDAIRTATWEVTTLYEDSPSTCENLVDDADAERAFRMAEQTIESRARATDRVSKSLLLITWLVLGTPLVVVAAVAFVAFVLIIGGETTMGAWLAFGSLVFPLVWQLMLRRRRVRRGVPNGGGTGE